jgi:outer membrane autotransporter protein
LIKGIRSHPLNARSLAPAKGVKSVLTLIAALTLKAHLAFAQGSTITGLNTIETIGAPFTVIVPGANAPSGFAGKNITLNYLGDTKVISSYGTSQGTFASLQIADLITLRRNLSEATPSNNITWNQIISHPSANTFTLAGPSIVQEAAEFGGQKLNLFTGADNIFGNHGDGNGDNNNIERIDSVFSTSGITVNKTLSFAVFERGPPTGHDGFKIAAITGVDSKGNPTSYGPLIDVLADSWGTASLGPLVTLVTRNNANQPGTGATHPSAITTGQVLGGVSLNLVQDLGVPAGTTVFGYSLFSPDVAANANLADWNSFPTNTNANSVGGLDPAAYNGVLFYAVSGNPGPLTDWALPGDGNFSDPGNWLGQATPNALKTAIVNNGTTATLTGNASVANIETGVGYSNANGNVAVNGGILSVVGVVAMGVDGTGTLTVSNGATVTDSTTEIGQNAASNGTVIVDRAGSELISTGATTVGDSGDGILNIRNGGLVSDANASVATFRGSAGMAIVDGIGSRWNNRGTLAVGRGGDAVIELTNGGRVSDATTEIGQNAGANGAVIVDGAGSELISTAATTVGDAGNGILNIRNGGLVSDANASVATFRGSAGLVIVDGIGSQWNNSLALDVGRGGTGVIELANGGTVAAGGGTTIEPLGAVTGNGTITTPLLVNNGVLAPAAEDNNPGTMVVKGNYQQGADGILRIGVAGPLASQADRLNVTGAAALDGTLILSSLNNFHPSAGANYQFVTAAGGLTGGFSKVVDTLDTAGLTRMEVVAPNGILMAYLPSVGMPAVLTLRTAEFLTTTPLTAAKVGAILVPLLDPNIWELATPEEIWFSEANTQRFNIESRFDNLMVGSTGLASNVSFPGPSSTGEQLVENKGDAAGKAIEDVRSDPLQPTPENRWGVWVTGFGDFVNVDNEGQVEGYRFNAGGVTVGADYRLTDHFVIGLVGGYAHTWTDLNPSGSVDDNAGWGGGYAGYFGHGLYIDGAAFVGADSFDTVRAALLSSSATGSSNGHAFSTFIAGGYDFHIGQLRMGPTAALQYSSATIEAFSENGSIAPVMVSSNSQHSLRTDFGLRGWTEFHLAQLGLRPFFRTAWEHEYEESPLSVSAALVDIPGSSTTITGPSLGHDSVVVNAGVAVEWTRNFSTYISYDGQLGRDRYDSNGLSGGLQISF